MSMDERGSVKQRQGGSGRSGLVEAGFPDGLAKGKSDVPSPISCTLLVSSAGWMERLEQAGVPAADACRGALPV